MLEREELKKSGAPGFSIGQKEKDYVQHWVLSYLGREGFIGVFKGGTALQKAYSLPRYSEDLDFTLNEAELPEFEAISRYLVSAGFGNPRWKEEEKSAKLKVQGPLYSGSEISECAISMDFSEREKTLLPPSLIEIRPAYPDIMPYSLRVMDGKEIAAEKVRAIYTRTSARDLYDLDFLARQGKIPKAELIDGKLAGQGMKYSRTSFEDAINRLAEVWKGELTAFVAQVPEYKAVKEEVLGAFPLNAEG